MTNIIETLFKPFIKFLFPSPLSIFPIAPLIAGGVQAAIAGGVTAGAAGAGIAGGAAAAGAGGGAGLLSGLLGKGNLPNILGTVLGAGQSIAGGAKGKQAQKFMPPPEDPEMRGFLSEIQRKRKQLETGAALEPAAAELRKQQVQTQKNILRLSGGAGGAAIAGTTRAQRATGTAFAEVAAKAGEKEMFLTQLAGKTITDVAQRRLELQLLQRSQALAESAQLKSEGMSNIMAGIAGGIPLGKGGEGGVNFSLEQLQQLLGGKGQQTQTPTGGV